ncbi:MAG: hypothetical protein WKF87_16975 [Chryseolinea sp.]
MKFRSRAVNLLISILLLMFMAPGAAVAQQAVLDTLLKKFDAYRISEPSEKVYLHLDRSVYLTGETMWFKFYLVNGATHTLNDVSKVAYLEVVDTENRPVLQTKINMQGGYGHGSLFLPASIVTGSYTIRGYTSWMKNFSPNFFFHQGVSIVNTFRKLEMEKPKPPLKGDLKLFPEGGNLVGGLMSKVAFTWRNSSKGSTYQGSIINQRRDTVATFHPDSTGMGSFLLKPIFDEEYSAIVEDEKGNRISFPMPKIVEKGYVLSAYDTVGGNIAIRIQSNSSTVTTQPIFLVIHSRNMISNASMHFLPTGKLTVLIKKEIMRKGISQITLFNYNMEPLCERLLFQVPDKLMSFEIQTGQREYGIRRKVTLDITSSNAGKAPVSGNLSVAVYRVDSIQDRSSGNIFNNLWLTSDLPEMPPLPSDFLHNITEDKRQFLDNVMLTNGWRRFKWDTIVAGTSRILEFVPEVRGHIIRGKIVTAENTPATGVTTYLSSPGLNVQVYGSISNNLGNIKFEMKDFSGPRRIVVQPNITMDSTTRIKILSPFSDKFMVRRSRPFALDYTLRNDLLERSLAMQVQDIFYQDKGAQSRSSNVDTTAFYGKPDATYYLEDYTRFPVMEEILREYVPGVLVRKRRDGFHFINLDVVNKGVFDTDPFIMLDGIPIFDADKIMAFDPLKVKKLEVVLRRYYHGVLSLPGIVSFTTYNGDLSGFQLDPRSLVLDYEGLQFQREFYTPKYENSRQRESRMPDQRNLLFWAPLVITDKIGKQHLEFYTSDLTGDYHVLVEGMAGDGSAGSGTVDFSVRAFEN